MKIQDLKKIRWDTVAGTHLLASAHAPAYVDFFGAVARSGINATATVTLTVANFQQE
jgi:hypothetical protein